MRGSQQNLAPPPNPWEILRTVHASEQATKIPLGEGFNVEKVWGGGNQVG